MPQVPYDPVPQIPAEDPRIRRPEVEAPPAAFGVNIAQGVRQVGETGEQIGNELFSRAIALQQLNNENAARERQNEYAIQSSLLHAQFGALTGKAAAEQLPGFLQQQADLRRRLGEGLTPMAKKMYDADSMPFMQRNVFSAAGHAAEENKKFTIDTLTSRADLIAQDVEDNPTGPADRKQKMGDLYEEAAMNKFGVNDPNDPNVKDARFKAESKYEYRRLVGMAERGNSLEALEELPDIKMTDDDKNRATNIIQAHAIHTATANLAQGAYDTYRQPDGTFSKTQTQVHEELRDRARKLFPNNTDMQARVITDSVQQYDHLVNQDRWGTRVDNQETKNQIAQTVVRYNVQNAQEFQATPEGRAIFNKMDPVQQKALPNTINTILDSFRKASNKEVMMQINGLKAGGRTEDLLNINEYDPKLALSYDDIQKVQKLKADAVAHPRDDPRVSRALGWMRDAYRSSGLMEDLGLMHRDAKHPEDYDHFVGALQEWLNEKVEEGKPADYNTVIDEGAKILFRQHAVLRGMFADPFGLRGPAQDYSFKQWERPMPNAVPDEFRDKAIDEAIRGGGAMPTDHQIYRAYVRAKFNDLMKEESSGGTSVSGR